MADDVDPSCLFLESVVDKIIGCLKFKDKFKIQRVCRVWRRRSLVCLQDQKELLIHRTKEFRLDYRRSCYYHPVSEFSESCIKWPYSDQEFWSRMMETMPRLEVIFLDHESDHDDESDPSQEYLLSLIQLIVCKQAKSVKCLWMPGFSHWFREDYKIPDVDILPQLLDVGFYAVTNSNMVQLLKSSPKLRYMMTCAHEFGSNGEWHLLPKGFKRLESADGSFKELHSFLSSPIVETIEVLNYIRIIPEIYSKPFYFDNLREIRISIKDKANDCLVHFARMLRFSRVVEHVDLFILTDEQLTVENWESVFQGCSRVTDFQVYLPPRIHFMEGFVGGIVSNMTNLRILFLGFAISSQCLTLLTKLDHLEVFTELVFDPENLFTGDALVDFLEVCFLKKMTRYEVNIRHTYWGMSIPFPRNFIERITALANQLSLKLEIQSAEETAKATAEVLIQDLKIYRQN